jgi:hypothetical protein
MTIESQLQAAGAWLAHVTGLADDHVVIAPFNGTRPSLTYITVQLLGPSIAPQHDEVRVLQPAEGAEPGTATREVRGYRTARLDVNIYGPTVTTYDLAQTIRLQLWSTSGQQKAAELGLQVLSIGDARDLSMLRDTRYEGRLQMELTLGWRVKLTETVATIEQVVLTSELVSSDDDTSPLEDVLEFGQAVPPSED